MFPENFFEDSYRLLFDSNREISAEKNQILTNAGCSKIIGANEYYAGSRTLLVIDCRAVTDGYIHGRGVGLCNYLMCFRLSHSHRCRRLNY